MDVEIPNLKLLLQKLLNSPNDELIQNIVNGERLIDEEHLIVVNTNLGADSQRLLNKIEAAGVDLSKFFTTDAKVSLNLILQSIRSIASIDLPCNVCNLSSAHSEIKCNECNLSYRLKCVKVTYVPKKVPWVCKNCK